MASLAAAVGQRILTRFPPHFSFCFSYGSGVKQQLGYTDLQPKARHPNDGPTRPSALATPMIDLILCVDDAAQWHEENLRLNPGDYSAAARLAGSHQITKWQQQYGARIYCNTLVPLASGERIKYGVISTDDLLDDLRNWRYLYVAGRLHKPVEILQRPTTKSIEAALVDNRRSAVHVALLRLPETFTTFDMFYAVANLSYAGDFRMYFGEKKDKVRNIVTPQLDEFYDCYRPILDDLQRSGLVSLPNDGRGTISQDVSVSGVERNLLQIPDGLKEMLVNSDDDIGRLAKNPLMRKRLGESLELIVFNSSATQSLKNIPSAGLGKAIRYSWQKVLKTFNM